MRTMRSLCTATKSSSKDPAQPKINEFFKKTQLAKFVSIKFVVLSNHLILYSPLLLLPSIFPSIRVFYSESVLHIRWPKYWSFSFNISPSSEYSGLISFRSDWFSLLAVQGTLKSLLQHHSLEVSIFQLSAFFMVQKLSHPYMTTAKTIDLTRRNFVGKMMSLLFNMLKVCRSFPFKEHASFSFMAAVTVHSDPGAQEKKICHCFHFSPSINICHEVMGLDAMILVF